MAPIGSGIDAQLGAADEVYTNEVQTLTVTGAPTGGSVTVLVDGATSGPIAFNATSGVAQAVFDAMPLGAGQLVVSGGPWPGTPLTVTFSGSQVAKRDVPQITLAVNSFTGGAAPTLVPTTATPGAGYGNPVTPARFFEFTELAPKVNVSRIDSKAWRRGQLVGPRADRYATNKIDAGGPVGLEGVTKSLGFWLNHMHGAFVTTTPAGGTLTRDHTFTLADLWNKSFTLQGGYPMANDIPSVQPFTWVGCKITDWEIGVDVDGILDIKATVDAKDERTDVALAAQSYPAGLELLTYVGGQVTIAGANQELKTFNLKRQTAMNTGRRYVRKDTLKREPILAGLGSLGGSMSIEFRTLYHYNLFVAGTPAVMTALFEGPTIIELAYKPMLLVTAPAIRFDGDTPKMNGADLVMQDLPYTVLAPTDASSPITSVYRTTDTTP